jgi:uncharacterized protein Yka (UPF0111/DUF47 family)
MGFFSPKDKSYLAYYKRLGEYVIASVKTLNEMINSSHKDYEKFSKKIRQIEESADEVKLEVSAWTRKTFVTPYDRDEMYRLASLTDDIVDNYDKVIDTIFLFDIKDLPKKVAKQVNILDEISVRIFAVLTGLSDIKAHTNELEQILELVIDSENARRSFLANLFNDKKADPVDLIKAKSLTDALNDVAHSYKAVTSLAQMISIKES